MRVIWIFPVWLYAGFTLAQQPHARTETFHIAGNCAACKQTIEHSGSRKGEATLIWDAESQLATVTYDTTVTTADDVLKRVAYAGYDNERYLAPPEAYAELETCCQYERVTHARAVDGKAHAEESHPIGHAADQPAIAAQQPSVDNALSFYFSLKEALVSGNQKEAAAAATALAKEVQALPTPEAEQTAPMAVAVAKAKTLEDQRAQFAGLSENMYSLVKKNNASSTVYYQHCPMYNKGKGANWLSAEETIRNPYYGDRMISCGSVVETLQKK
mgnify:CR=1 FL=1